MCGICGVYNARSGQPVATRLIECMMDVLAHRGPDDQGLYLEQALGLGFRRLSIVDLASGQQPVTNETGTIQLVFNGEIWNYRELRRELQARGHRMRAQSDAEVIVHAYEEDGPACLARLHGMFALALWDASRQRLLLARDRVGKKPLYYTRVGGDLLFASEIKALFCNPRVPRQLDLQALSDFLSIRYVPGPATIFKDIYKLQPGHWLLCERGTWREECYWDFAFEPLKQDQSLPLATRLQEIRQHVQRAVAERLIGDAWPGAFLSGGVDSSIIVGLMSQLSAHPIQTFAVGFDTPGYSELPYARLVAERFHTEHHELVLSSAELPAYWPLLTWHRDEPVSEPSDLGVYLISRLARRHVKTVLSGEGGDELFAGYPKYAMDGLAGIYQFLPAMLRQGMITPLAERLPYRMRKLRLAARTLSEPAPQRWVNWFGIFPEPLKEQLLTPQLKAQVDLNASRLFQRWLDQHPQRDDLSRMLYLDTKIWLPDNLLMKADKMGMAASLEARLPLLDEHLVAYAASIPSHLKVHNWQTKWILKQAFADLLPRPILTRRKMGFNVPTGTWFREGQRAFLSNLLLSEQARSRDLFNASFVEHLLRAHLDGRSNYQAQLFTLASLEIWLRVFIDPPSLVSPYRAAEGLEQEYAINPN